MCVCDLGHRQHVTTQNNILRLVSASFLFRLVKLILLGSLFWQVSYFVRSFCRYSEALGSASFLVHSVNIPRLVGSASFVVRSLTIRSLLD